MVATNFNSNRQPLLGALPEFLFILSKKVHSPMKYCKFFLFLLIGFAFSQPALAQDPDDLPSGEIDIIKSFDARLGDAERYQVDPELPALETSTAVGVQYVFPHPAC